MFAKWWSLQPDLGPFVQRVVTARFIMNNDLSRITPETESLPTVSFTLPFHIHIPARSFSAVDRVWHRQLPGSAFWLTMMISGIVMLDVDPGANILDEARISPDPKHLYDLESKIPERWCRSQKQLESRHKSVMRLNMFDYTSTVPVDNVAHDPLADVESSFPYDSHRTNMAKYEFRACMTDEMSTMAEDLWDKEPISFCFDEYYQSLSEVNRSSS
ncbi:hypothetical protein BDV23DRAFT_180282 [Aspergillus alliaceus]|uniref:Uncharacterized protein n=1 Tax=Petromyces alliaceus TaxID=209559 RepID=A0A5N7CI16_PETAA|nr:hypothetical protein BDV23DRAFT_180282 [Aspergillus alliaceus]